MSQEFKAFRSFILKQNGVTYVGPEHTPTIGVETEAHAQFIRRFINPDITVVVTGPVLVPPPAPAKHPGVQTYEDVANATDPKKDPS